MDPQTLHRAMLLPRTYPGGPGPVQFRETHVSRLYFVGDLVYKVKKPVDFGFLNFTSLDRRKFYCHEEVRLNRRFSPGVYLDVVEIRLSGRRITVGGSGRIVDYAVRMKRLPEAAMLSHLLERQDPSLPERMTRLADHLASLHAGLEPHCEPSGSSHLDVVSHNWEENFIQTEPFIGRTLSAATHSRLSAHIREFLSQQANLILNREQQGWVRDGHGDLHCEHICFLDPEIVIYDCIEFNRRFRIADVLADLAFLLMDLEYRGRPDLADLVRRSYLGAEAQQDDEIRSLLRFYQIYRAYVRGKVESFLCADPNAGEPARQAAAARARRYFQLALGYLCPASMIMTCGLMGSGKTTLARQLAGILAAPLLRSDQIRKECFAVSAGQGRDDAFNSGLYQPDITRRTYGELLERARAVLAEGRTVVVDASFARRQERDAFRQAAREAGVPTWLLFMDCERKTALQRMAQRQQAGQDLSDGRPALYEAQAACFEIPSEGPGVLHLDADRPVEILAEEVLEAMLAGSSGAAE
jgi:uncharacterized protein